MRFSPPAWSSRARRASSLEGRVGLLLLAATGAFSCGRLGFDAVAKDAGQGPTDASVDRDAARDGSPMADAPVTVDGPAIDAPAVDAPDVSDASADAADASCPVSTTVDYCTALPPLPAPPVIDGTLDCGPALVAAPPVDWSGPPPLPAFPAGNSAQMAMAWRPDGLYVFIAVTTPAAFPADMTDPAFYGAGVELFVDSDGVYASPPSYDNPGTIQLVVPAPADAVTPSLRGEGFRNAADEGPWASTQFAAYPSATGFVFEGFVAAADLGLSTWRLAAGDTVGLDVAVDVSFPTAAMTGPQGHRVGQYFFHLTTASGDAAAFGLPYSDPRSFCAPTLAGQ
jgi:hypothetical protein